MYNFSQIEVTTFCNFSCKYCYTQSLKNSHIKDDVFYGIVDSFMSKQIVHLQGEGEPTLHPSLWKFADYCKNKNHITSITTNGSYRLVDRLAKYFSKITISIDTLSRDEANKIGRTLDNVEDNIDRLLKLIDHNSLSIALVDYGQNYSDVVSFCFDRKLKLNIQKLQKKDDYIQVYADFLPIAKKSRLLKKSCIRLSESSAVDFYDVSGVKLPCCFIKNSAKFISKKHHREELLSNVVPDCCSGCSFIM